MNKRITDEELRAIRERADKAVYAPWRIGKQSPNGLYNVGSTDGLLTAQTTNEANAAFIANSRQDIPKLLAEIERLNKLVEYYAYDACSDGDDGYRARKYLNGGDSGWITYLFRNVYRNFNDLIRCIYFR